MSNRAESPSNGRLGLTCSLPGSFGVNVLAHNGCTRLQIRYRSQPTLVSYTTGLLCLAHLAAPELQRTDSPMYDKPSLQYSLAVFDKGLRDTVESRAECNAMLITRKTIDACYPVLIIGMRPASWCTSYGLQHLKQLPGR